MPEPARTQRYEGLFPSQTQEMFEADAKTGRHADWYPLSETWSGTALFVVYEHDPERRTRPPQPAPTQSGPSSASAPGASGSRAAERRHPAAVRRPRRPPWGSWPVIAVLGVLALTMFSFQSWDRPGTSLARPVIPATPKPVRFTDGVWRVPDEHHPRRLPRGHAQGLLLGTIARALR